MDISIQIHGHKSGYVVGETCKTVFYYLTKQLQSLSIVE